MSQGRRDALTRLAERFAAVDLRSRTVRLNRLTMSAALDLARWGERDRGEVWQKLVALLGRADEGRVELCRVKPADEEGQKLAHELGMLAASARSHWLETGLRDLAVGWPFLEGSLPDGTWIRAPLLLFPVWLEQTRDGVLAWELELRGLPQLNLSLANTLRSRAGIELDLDVVLRGDDDRLLAIDPPTWTELHATLLALFELDQEPWSPRPRRFEAMSERQRESASGVTLRHHAILGRFPPSGSSVMGDYEALLAGSVDGEALGRAAELLDVGEMTVPSHGESPRRRTGERAAPSDGPGLDAFAGARRHLALRSDESQDEVVRWLERGGSGLVVEGPPGTGKSQMIANVVTAAMMEGLRVLLVCDKRAALDVVAQRLTHAGLGEPLSLVHDASADRARVCAGLVATLDELKPKTRETRREEEAIDRSVERASTRLRLTQEAWTWLSSSPNGRLSLNEIELALAEDPGHELPELAPLLEGVGSPEVERALPEVEALSRESEAFAHPHPLAHRGDWSLLDDASFAALEHAFEAALGACERLLAVAGARITPRVLESSGCVWDDANGVLDLIEGGDPAKLDRFLLFWAWTGGESSDGEWRRVMRTLQAARERLTPAPYELIGEERRTLERWVSDLDELERASVGWARIFRGAYWRHRRLPAAILDRCPSLVEARGHASGALPVNVARLCKSALEWHELIAALPFDNPFMHFGLQGELDSIVEAIESIRVQHGLVRSLHALREGLAPHDAVYRALPELEKSSDLAKSPFFEAALADRRSLCAVRELRAALASLREVAEAARGDAATPEATGRMFGCFVELALDGRRAEARGELERLRAAWLERGEARLLDRRLAHLMPWARRFLRGWRRAPVTGSTGRDAWLAVLRGWRHAALAGRSRAALIAPLIDDELLERLGDDFDACERDAARRASTRYRARAARLASEGDSGKALRQLAAEARKQRRRLTLRQLVEKYWDHGLSAISPVWLCSPDSVASLFPMKTGSFDLVIFDEASQCPVEAALPACVRARRVLVAGDLQQMPPSRFFQTSHGVDDEEGALFGSQSLLELAQIAWPSITLKSHYRSHHEELIAFSNRAFYSNALVTAPRAELEPKAEFEGLRFTMADGFWCEQRNVVEAEQVVQRVHELLGSQTRDGRVPSVGVVAFNLNQAELVEELLARRAATDEEFRRRVSRDRGRPPVEQLFVRNLENVQGDERDVIVFTCAYGPSGPGEEVQLRFGPLGLEGGEKRLNVAITRARLGMHVFASFDPRRVTVRTKHQGPQLFVRYLRFVQAMASGEHEIAQAALDEVGTLGEDRSHERARPAHTEDAAGLESLCAAIASELGSRGLVVRRRHGLGTRRVDLAVGRNGAGLRVGIDCSRFAAVAEPLVRDVYDRSTWRRLGWTIVRVTPGDWLEHADAVAERIVALVDAPRG